MTDRRDTEPKLDEKRILSALDDILASDTFSRSPKVSRLLGYLVERRLAGDEDGLKEARIAQHVFNQPDEFNPRANPIVRVNASRLRNLLRLYYSGPGAEDELRIMLPDVGYRPDFPGAPAAAHPPVREPAQETMPAGNGQCSRHAPPLPSPQPPPAASCAPGQEMANGEKTAQDGQTACAHREARPNGGTCETDTATTPGQIRAPGNSMNFGRQGVLALVLANLMLAGAFAVLAGRGGELNVRHVLSFPVQAADGQDTGEDSPLFMLCNRNAPGGGDSREAFPVAIGEDTFLCWPVQLRQAELPRNPV